MPPVETHTVDDVAQDGPINGKSAKKKRPFLMKKTNPEEPADQILAPVTPGAGVPPTPEKPLSAEDDPYAKATEEERKRFESESAPRFMERRVDQTLLGWLEQLGPRADVKVAVHRSRPDTFKGQSTKGLVQTYTHLISDEELQAEHGGGTYQIRVMTPHPHTGQYRFKGSTVIDVAGEPKLPNLNPAPAASGEISPLTQRFLDSASEDRRRAQDEIQKLRDKAEQGGGQMLAQLSIMMKPLEAQIAQMAADKRAMEDRHERTLAEAKATPTTNPLMDKIFEQSVGNAEARMASIKMQHESEIRVLKENHAADLARLRDANDRDREYMIRTHERALEDVRSALIRENTFLKESFGRELANTSTIQKTMQISTEATANIQKTVLEKENERLQAELRENKVELRELRAKKDQTLAEKVSEITAVRDLMGGDDEKEKSTLEKVVEVAVGSEKVMEFVGRLAGGNPNAVAEQPQIVATIQPRQQVLPQPQRVRRVRHVETGAVHLEHPDGTKTPMTVRGPDGAAEAVYAIDPETLKKVVMGLEAACRTAKPEVFVTGYRSLIPPAILQAIRRDGVDGFLTKVAQLDQASPLNTQEGRNWVRKVGKLLLGEVD